MTAQKTKFKFGDKVRYENKRAIVDKDLGDKVWILLFAKYAPCENGFVDKFRLKRGWEK